MLNIALLLLALGQFAGSNTGELRLTVSDPSGLPLECSVELTSEATAVRQDLRTGADGRLEAKRLPFGTYRLAVVRDGFAPFAELIDIRTALPIERHVTLMLATVQAQVTVSAGDTLLDVRQTAPVRRIGAEALQERASALPGRGIVDLVNTQPGWLLEANGILHPRGSEYQTQYVVDGLPLTDNRSPAFAPEIDADDVHAMNILTGGYPAEYGRKLGGVIEVATAGQARRGFHGSAGASLGSFATRSGDAAAEYGWPRTTISVTAGAAGTDRYLDPPIEENATNHGSTSHLAAHFEHDATDADRIGLIVRYGAARFLVPNERVQEEAGQRQDRESEETAAQFSYQRILPAPVILDVRGMARDLSARLWSNPQATPVAAQQDRGFRDLYVKAALAGHAGVHEWKAGGDVAAGTVRERFSYRIADPAAFDPGTPPAFDFDDRRADREAAVFAQDQVRWRRWTVNAGIRWDRYHLAAEDAAISPRLGVACRPGAARIVRPRVPDAGGREPAPHELAGRRRVELERAAAARAAVARQLLRNRRVEGAGGQGAARRDVVHAADERLRRRRSAAEYRRELSDRVSPRADHRYGAEARCPEVEGAERVDQLRVDARRRRAADNGRAVSWRRSLRAPGVERYAEVGAENRRDSSCGRLRDHRDELLVEQWLAPVVELDLPQRIAELGEDPAVKGQ